MNEPINGRTRFQRVSCQFLASHGSWDLWKDHVHMFLYVTGPYGEEGTSTHYFPQERWCELPEDTRDFFNAYKNLCS